MVRTDLRTVDEYIDSQPEPARHILTQVRETIRKAVPKAQEVISYKMPAYLLNGVRLLQFAAWKQHYSIYTGTTQVAAEFHKELASYEIDKGTIRFPLSDPIPVNLISRIAKFRARAISQRVRPAVSSTKKR